MSFEKSTTNGACFVLLAEFFSVINQAYLERDQPLNTAAMQIINVAH